MDDSHARNFPASRKLQKNENDLIQVEEGEVNKPEALNARALSVISRVSNKLTGKMRK